MEGATGVTIWLTVHWLSSLILQIRSKIQAFSPAAFDMSAVSRTTWGASTLGYHVHKSNVKTGFHAGSCSG